MASITKLFVPRLVEQHGHDHAGVFTWDIDADLFYADEAVARLFEIDPRQAEKGLPLLAYLDRIHPDDRCRAAKSVHDTILSGGPCQQDYRVLQSQGPAISIMAFGCCFKGRKGGTSHYAGIIHPVPVEQSPETMLRSHCLAAHAAAAVQGHTTVAGHLASAIQQLDHDVGTQPDQSAIR